MGLFSRLLGKSKPEQRYNLENPAVAMTGGSLAMVGYGGPSVPSPFGIVTPEIANQFSAYHCAVRIIAETMASLPLIVYRKTGQGRVRATDHPLYDLLHSRPNDVMSSFTWREIMVESAINRGESFNYLETTKGGQIANLLPLQSQNVKTYLVNGQKVFRVKTGQSGTGQEIDVPDSEMLHVMGETYDGIRGCSVVEKARNTVALALAAEHHGMQYFAQGASPSGVLEYPRTLTDKARMALKQSWEQAYGGIKGAHRVPILEEGLKFTPISLTNEDSQWIASRTFQINEIARWFRIPPHMLGELSRSTNNNIEQQSLEFVQNCIRIWAERVEAELERKLLSQAERKTYHIEFLLEGLVRADLKTRMESYAIARQWGIYSANECREMENRNTYDGGDIYLSPMNMVDAFQLTAPPPAPDGGEVEQKPEEDTDSQDAQDEGNNALPVHVESRHLLASTDRIIEASVVALADPLSRMFTKESQARKRESFNADEFYLKHEITLSAAIIPALQALSGTLAAVRGIEPDKASEAARLVADDAAKKHCQSRATDYDPQTAAKDIAQQLSKLI